MKMSAPLSEEQQLVMLESGGPTGNLALTNHETEYRLCEIAKAAAGIKKLLGMHFLALHMKSFRAIATHMRQYSEELLRRFVDENGGPPRRAQTPWLEVDVTLDFERGVF